MVRLVSTERDGHGDRARPNRERESERIEGAAKNIVGIHFFLDFGAAVHFLFAFQHGPAIGNNNQAAADLHDGNGDSKKMQNVRADDERGDQQDKTVQGDMPRQDAAHRVRILSREGEKHGTAAERIDDWKQGGEDEQDTFGDFQEGILRRGEYSRGEAFAGFLVRGVPPPGVFVQRVRNCLKIKGLSFSLCQRVRKNVKRKNLRCSASASSAKWVPKWELLNTHPARFRPVEPSGMQNSQKSGKHRACKIRKMKECASL